MATTDEPLVGDALTRSNSVSQIRSEFDTFLYASVEARNDQPLLSVISALARLDIDPWQEAEKLSHMSREKAAWRLAALIETLPSDPSTHMNCRAVATRLVALLPRQVTINIPLRAETLHFGMPANVRAVMALIMLNVLLTALFFNYRNAVASQPPTVQAKHAQSPATASVKRAVQSPQPRKQ